uniref:Submandibular glandular kallikrein-9 n=1 Tax=Lygus hesperus TaxID=30085 RepID=A0A0A9WFV7_LYGHE
MIAPRIVLTACHCIATFWKFDENTKRVDPVEKEVWEDHNIIFRPGLNYNYVSGVDTDNPSLAIEAPVEFMYSKKYYIHDKCKHIYRRVYSFDFGFIFLNKQFLGVPFYLELLNPRVPPPKWSDEPEYYAPLVTEKTMEDAWAAVQRHQTTCLHLGFGWDKYFSGIYYSLPAALQLKFSWRSVASYTWCANHIKKTYNLPYNSSVWQTVFKCDAGYKDCATWDCSVSTGRITGVPAVGDDGGPVICDGLQYALITGTFANQLGHLHQPIGLQLPVFC